jgi:hypothetical protein
MEKALNLCVSGYCCSKYDNPESIGKCLEDLPDDWNGLCPFQNGTGITKDMLNEDGDVPVECRGRDGNPCKCVMSISKYISWNGLCAYQDD